MIIVFFVESVYSGDPDSLDGTSSELMMMEDDDGGEHGGRSPHFTIIRNPPSTSPHADPLTMFQLERSAHLETRQELSQLKKRFEVLRDEFDSGEGMSDTTSLLFNNQVSLYSSPRVCTQTFHQTCTLRKLFERTPFISFCFSWVLGGLRLRNTVFSIYALWWLHHPLETFLALFEHMLQKFLPRLKRF